MFAAGLRVFNDVKARQSAARVLEMNFEDKRLEATRLARQSGKNGYTLKNRPSNTSHI